jgi:putative hydrolase of the HAD superfamily
MSSRPDTRPSAVVVDADNTLWDTNQVFDDIALREKPRRAFSDVREGIDDALAGEPAAASEPDVVVIGDSLKRDVRPANAVGCTTVYCPGDFKGHEPPDSPGEPPEHTVSSLDEALDVLGL